MEIENSNLLRSPRAIALALSCAVFFLFTAFAGTTSIRRGLPALASPLLLVAAFGLVLSLRALLRLSVAVVGSTAVIKNWFRSYSVPTSQIVGFKWGSAMMSELNWKETMSVPDQMPYLLLEDGTHIQINSLQASRRSRSRELTRNALEHQFGALLTSELVA
jgi:glucan phosphoethanolaminetransferase (alkaline phosphatase superfamily)